MTMNRLRTALHGPSRAPGVTKNHRIREILVAVLGWTITIVVIRYHLSQISTFLHHPHAAETVYTTTPDAHYLLPAYNSAVKRSTRSQVMSALKEMHEGISLDRGRVANILNESKTSLQALDNVYSVPIKKKDQEGNSPYSSKKVTVSIRAAAMYYIQLLGIYSSNCFVSPNIDYR